MGAEGHGRAEISGVGTVEWSRSDDECLREIGHACRGDWNQALQSPMLATLMKQHTIDVIMNNWRSLFIEGVTLKDERENQTPNAHPTPHTTQPWTKEETEALCQGYELLGNNWSAILRHERFAKALQARTSSSLPSKWTRLPAAIREDYERRYHRLNGTMHLLQQKQMQNEAPGRPVSVQRKRHSLSRGESNDTDGSPDKSWQRDEIEALRFGVKTYGNDWNKILNDPDISKKLKNRSVLSLKSKWGRISKTLPNKTPVASPTPATYQQNAFDVQHDDMVSAIPDDKIGRTVVSPNLAPTPTPSYMEEAPMKPKSASLSVPFHSLDEKKKISFLYNTRGLSAYEVGRRLQSLEDLSYSIAIHPDYKEAYLNRSLVHCMSADYDSALLDALMATEINPFDVDCSITRAIAYAFNRHFLKCIEDCNTAIRHDDRRCEAFLIRSIAMISHAQRTKSASVKTKTIQDAVVDIRHAVHIDPKSECAKHLFAFFSQAQWTNAQAQSSILVKRSLVANLRWLMSVVLGDMSEMANSAVAEQVAATKISRRGIMDDCIRRLMVVCMGIEEDINMHQLKALETATDMDVDTDTTEGAEFQIETVPGPDALDPLLHMQLEANDETPLLETLIMQSTLG